LDPDPGCTLIYPSKCTKGTLVSAPNPAVNATGNLCATGPNIAPVLPSSIEYTFSEKGWRQPSYFLDPLRRSDVDCDDPFFSEACTADFCAAENSAMVKTGQIMSIPFLVSVGLSPFFGFVVNRIKLRALLSVVAPVLLLHAHVHMGLWGKESSPILPLVEQGMALALLGSVVLPSIPLTVTPCRVGIAFGMVAAIQNFALAIVPIVVSEIYNSHGHRFIPNVELLFIVLALIGTGVGIALNVVDACTGGKLNHYQYNFWREKEHTSENDNFGTTNNFFIPAENALV